MQELVQICSGKAHVLEIPSPRTMALPGICWGRLDQAFTPAFWKAQTWLEQLLRPQLNFRIGKSLEEEVVACLLGGHGIPAEVGLAAFRHLRDEGFIRLPPPSQPQIEQQLRRPIAVGDRSVRYRFAAQKSCYIAAALQALHESRPDTKTGSALRAWFLKLKGIGPKTASWIARNWLGCDDVAIIDIHVSRALALAGVIKLDSIRRSSYFDIEERFLNFSSVIGERPSVLDAVIWRQMRLAGAVVQRSLGFDRAA